MTQKPITDVGGLHLDISQLMSPSNDQRQSMQGFDDDYVDIVDFIVRCTHKIWEEGGIGLIYTHYTHNAITHTSDGDIYGRDPVIAGSIKHLAAFPDLRLYADDVIWSGNHQDGFHSSHRITFVGHNTGYSSYGPPTGRRVVQRLIAHCVVKANRIVEEWEAGDELALVRQLGFDEHELARKISAQEAARSQPIPRPVGHGEIERLKGQETPVELPPKTGAGFDIEDFVRRSYHELWNWRLFNKIEHNYASNYLCHTSGNRDVYGTGEFKAYLLSFFAAFSDLALSIDHICWLGDERAGYRVAVRWTLQGTHQGPGVWGEPTGQRIRLIGITHHEVKQGKFVQEWMVFDEFSLLKQLYRPVG
ncbi:MAG: ester cyclase [Anaerolineales bacterium]